MPWSSEEKHECVEIGYEGTDKVVLTYTLLDNLDTFVTKVIIEELGLSRTPISKIIITIISCSLSKKWTYICRL